MLIIDSKDCENIDKALKKYKKPCSLTIKGKTGFHKAFNQA